MGKIRHDKRHLLCLILLTILWMGVIFWFSAQNADDSSDLSSGLLTKLLSVVVPHWKDRTAAEQASILQGLHTVFRKCGHFSEYTILGLLLTASVGQYRKCITDSRQAFTKEVILLPALCALLYAASDEFHQKFVPGRSCELRDVCIDFSGAILGILLMNTAVWLFRRYIARKKAKKEALHDH